MRGWECGVMDETPCMGQGTGEGDRRQEGSEGRWTVAREAGRRVRVRVNRKRKGCSNSKSSKRRNGRRKIVKEKGRETGVRGIQKLGIGQVSKREEARKE